MMLMTDGEWLAFNVMVQKAEGHKQLTLGEQQKWFKLWGKYVWEEMLGPSWLKRLLLGGKHG